MMRRSSLPLIVAGSLWTLAAVPQARADAPAIVPVQGFLTDEDGAPVDGKHRVILFLYDAATDGDVLHTDQFNNLEIVAGQFTVYLGSQDDAALDMSIFQEHADTWLEVVIDNQTISPRTRLGSVPYAAACGDAVTVGGQTVPADVFAGNYVKADQGTVEDLTVTGTLDPGTLRVQEFHMAPDAPFMLSSVNTIADVPDLTVTFTVAQTTPIMVSYVLSGANGEPMGTHLVTQLVIDGASVGNTITGNTGYWGNTGSYVGTVAAGSHTVKVRYRTPATTAISNPADYMSRRLDVLVLGR